jgi:ribosomal protein S27AE
MPGIGENFKVKCHDATRSASAMARSGRNGRCRTGRAACPARLRRNNLEGGALAMANVKVTCPHCGHQTWVREHYNDPCQHCGKAVPDPYVK